MVLVGCTGQDFTSYQILEGVKESFKQGQIYTTDQEDAVLLSALEKELERSKISLIKARDLDGQSGQYDFADDEISMTILIDEQVSLGHSLVSSIYIQAKNNYMRLADHPAIKAVAKVMGEEQLLTWLAEREGEMTQAGKINDDIRAVLALGRCYLSFDYWSGSDTRYVDFSWAFKPHVPESFTAIANQLEDEGLLVTGYVEGPGGETLTATNSHYYRLKRMASSRKSKPVGLNHAAAYQLMHDKNKPGSYSLQLYGYMRDDLAYPSKVEEMPGIDELAQLMKIGQETLGAITAEINAGLTEAKKARNKHYSGDYYREGRVGEYRYIITVPQGILVYNFTVLIEKI